DLHVRVAIAPEAHDARLSRAGRGGERLRAAVAGDQQLHLAPDRRLADHPDELGRPFDAVAVVFEDDVPIFQPGLRRGAVVLDALDFDAVLTLEAELLRAVGVDVGDADAEVAR